MLRIIFGDTENSIYSPDIYFNNRYEDEWITEPFSVEMIKNIDNSDVLSARVIDSPVLGPITPRELSGGVKTLMLMMYDRSGKIFNASACGDNCAKWIVEISRRKELTINLHHVMDFSDPGDFDAIIENTGVTIHNFAEYFDETGKFKER